MLNKIFIKILIFIFLIYPNSLLSLENSTTLYKEAARLAENGQLDAAIEKFKKVIEISPYYCLGHYGLGKAYLFMDGMLEDAIKHLKISVKLDTRFAKGYFYLGLAYYFSKKYVRAIHSFKKAYKNDDNLIEALYDIGMIYEIIGKEYESSIYFKKYYKEKRKGDEDILFGVEMNSLYKTL